MVAILRFMDALLLVTEEKFDQAEPELNGSYQVIAGDADRSPYQRQLTVRAGDAVTLDLSISLPTGA